MKRIIFFLATLLISFLSLAQRKSNREVYVNGYTRSNGTYVEPHYRTTPNLATPNWTDLGMVNPHNGKVGTIIPKNTIINNSTTNFYPESKVSDYTERYVNQIHKDDFSSDNKNKYLAQYNNSTIEVFSCSSIYDNPQGTGKQIEQACRGKVTLLSQYNEKYCKVKYENTIGFMEVRWIKLPSPNSNNYDTNSSATTWKESTKNSTDNLNFTNPNSYNSTDYNTNKSITTLKFSKETYEKFAKSQIASDAIKFNSKISYELKFSIKYTLYKLKYDTADEDENIDGNIDAKTVFAIMLFQVDHGHQSDGKIGPSTFRSIQIEAKRLFD